MKNYYVYYWDDKCTHLLVKFIIFEEFYDTNINNKYQNVSNIMYSIKK